MKVVVTVDDAGLEKADRSHDRRIPARRTLRSVRKNLVARLAEQAAEPEGLSPFERFRDLTKRLVAVPKAELDVAAEREKAKKRGAAAP